MEDAMPQGGPVPGARPGHENDRIGLRGVVFFTIALFVTVILIQVGLGLEMHWLKPGKAPDADLPAPNPIAVAPFPVPRLQANPMAEMVELREAESKRITSYGWVDKKAGIAHIPIDRAMDILARTGLPKVAAPPPVPGMPPNTSIPPGTKRDDAGPETKQGGSS